jgi:hypothetical protein
MRIRKSELQTSPIFYKNEVEKWTKSDLKQLISDLSANQQHPPQTAWAATNSK